MPRPTHEAMLKCLKRDSRGKRCFSFNTRCRADTVVVVVVVGAAAAAAMVALAFNILVAALP